MIECTRNTKPRYGQYCRRKTFSARNVGAFCTLGTIVSTGSACVTVGEVPDVAGSALSGVAADTLRMVVLARKTSASGFDHEPNITPGAGRRQAFCAF